MRKIEKKTIFAVFRASKKYYNKKPDPLPWNRRYLNVCFLLTDLRSQHDGDDGEDEQPERQHRHRQLGAGAALVAAVAWKEEEVGRGEHGRSSFVSPGTFV